MPHTINWFEIPATDFNRAVRFYSQILNIAMEKSNMARHDMGFFPWGENIVSGAVVSGEGYAPSDKGTLIYLNGGDDLNTVLSKVEMAGGKVLVPKSLINEQIGYYAIFLDTEGNRVALHSRG